MKQSGKQRLLRVGVSGKAHANLKSVLLRMPMGGALPSKAPMLSSIARSPSTVLFHRRQGADVFNAAALEVIAPSALVIHRWWGDNKLCLDLYGQAISLA